MLKNQSGQQWVVIAFDSATGDLVGSDEANITAKLRIGAGADLVDTGDTNPTPVTGQTGYYAFDLTAAETNADQVWIFPQSSTAGVRVLGFPPEYSPYNPVLAGIPVGAAASYYAADGTLTLVQRADYTADSALGALRIPIANASISAGDTVRLGANLSGQPTIQATGTVVEISGTKYAQIELTRATHTDRTASHRWRYELEHLASGGEVAPLIANKPLILLPSHAEPAA